MSDPSTLAHWNDLRCKAAAVADRACRFAHAEMSQAVGQMAAVAHDDSPRCYWHLLSPPDRDLCEWLIEFSGWRPPV